MTKSTRGPRHYAGLFLQAMVVYTAITIAIGLAATLVMAFLARPLVGLLLVAAFISGICFRRFLSHHLGARVAAWASPVVSSSRETHTGHRAA